MGKNMASQGRGVSTTKTNIHTFVSEMAFSCNMCLIDDAAIILTAFSIDKSHGIRMTCICRSADLCPAIQ